MFKTRSPLYHDPDGIGSGHSRIENGEPKSVDSGSGHSHAGDSIGSIAHEHMHELGIPHKHAGVHDHGAHGHTHRPESKKAVLNRMARIIGHMQSVKTMIENDRDCSDVLIQLSAIDSAVQSVSKVILKEHLSTCLIDAVREGDFEAIDDLNKAIDKFIK